MTRKVEKAVEKTFFLLLLLSLLFFLGLLCLGKTEGKNWTVCFQPRKKKKKCGVGTPREAEEGRMDRKNFPFPEPLRKKKTKMTTKGYNLNTQTTETRERY